MDGDRRKVYFERLGYAVSKGCPFRITSPLRGLKPVSGVHAVLTRTFRITSPLRGLKLRRIRLYQPKYYFRITSPLRGLKLLPEEQLGTSCFPLELLPHCGD